MPTDPFVDQFSYYLVHSQVVSGAHRVTWATPGISINHIPITHMQVILGRGAGRMSESVFLSHADCVGVLPAVGG